MGDGEDLKDKLAKTISDLADGEYKDFHKPFAEQATKIYYAYMGKDREGQEPTENWRSRVYPKTVKVKVLGAWSQFIQPLMNNNDPITVKPNIGEPNVEGAALMKDTILGQMEEADIEEKDKVSSMDLLMYGSCCQQFPMSVKYERQSYVPDRMAMIRAALMMEPRKIYKMRRSKEDAPSAFCRNIFDMRIHPGSTNIHDGDGVFFAPLISKHELMDLGNSAGFDKAALKAALETEPAETSDDGDTTRERQAARDYTGASKKGYQYLYYSGKLDADKLNEAGVEGFEDMKGHAEVMAHVVKAGSKSHLLAISPNTLLNKKRPFGWCVYERVPYELRGVGIGDNVLDMADIVVGGVRFFIDAKKLALPMIGVNASKRFPGSTIELRPFKTFLFDGDPETYLKQFQFKDVSDGIMTLIEFAERFMDEISGIPKFTTGFDSKMVNKTAMGLSMLINQQGQLMRGAIENYSDMIIEPRGEAFYHWNLLHHKDDRIKPAGTGYTVSSNGISALMVKEKQIEDLFRLLTFIINPVVAQSPQALRLLRMIGHMQNIKDVDGIIGDPDKSRMMGDYLRDPSMPPEAGMVSAPPGAMPMAGAVV